MPTVAHNSTADLIACPSCDSLTRMPPLKHGDTAHCRFCDQPLTQFQTNASDQVIAYAVSALTLFLIACLFPFLTLQVSGSENTMTLPGAPMAFYDRGMPVLAVIVSSFILILPLLLILLVLSLYIPLYLNKPASWLITAGRLIFTLETWCMVDVFLIALVVSLVKLSSMASITLGIAFWAYVGFAICFTLMISRIDRLHCWTGIESLMQLNDDKRISNTNTAGSIHHNAHPTAASQSLLACHLCYKVSPADSHDCPRCHSHLHTRKAASIQRTLALLFTATLLYIPANMFPIMTTSQFTDAEPSTILGGILVLIDMEAYPVATIIFLASVIVPLAKLIALYYLCWSVIQGGTDNLKQKTQLYRIAEFMGKWSMVDVFVVSILVALVQLQGLMSVEPGIAALSFSGVVIITMIAAESFDSRLIWDHTGRIDRVDNYGAGMLDVGEPSTGKIGAEEIGTKEFDIEKLDVRKLGVGKLDVGKPGAGEPR